MVREKDHVFYRFSTAVENTKGWEKEKGSRGLINVLAGLNWSRSVRKKSVIFYQTAHNLILFQPLEM